MPVVLAAAVGLACAAAAPAVLAQRADDNAVRSADDAFGTSVGNENIGLYNPFEVRGFSAVDAGNVRIDGLYFDQQIELSNHLAPSSAMRVGISAQGYPLPAPTGIVDYALARAGRDRVLSAVASYGPFGASDFELDAQLPLDGERLGLTAGATWSRNVTESGRSDRYWAVATTLTRRPAADVAITPFFGRTVNRDTEAEPLIFVDGPHLPPWVERGRFYGQSWTDGYGIGTNYGVVADARVGEWRLKAGAFRSEFEQPEGYVDLFLDTDPVGRARRLILADRDFGLGSTSGELRASRSVPLGEWLHTAHVAVRGRDQRRRFGGSDAFDAGAAVVGVPVALPRPAFEFGAQTREHVRQSAGAIAYEGRWGRHLELGAGLQKIRYRKDVDEPTGARPQGRDAPWVWNASAALHAGERVAFYASHATGLEEGGVAPDVAVNKNAAAPAIRTQQWDAGVRYALTRGVTLIAGVFDVRKPYYSLDAANVFRELGEQRSRGIEMSVTGQVVPGLNVVAGTVLLDPRVIGEEVDAGLVGRVPVAQTRRVTAASADWQLPWVPGLSVDVRLTSVGDRMASRDNRLEIPARTVYDAGARYRFTVGSAPVTIRGFVGNVRDKFGWRTGGSGVFITNAPRRYSLTIAADF
jgi:iron complex outermembrane receptor protein